MESRLSPDLLRIQPQVEDAALLPAWPELPLGDHITAFRNGFGRRPQGIEDGPIVARLSDIADGRLELIQPRRVKMSAREFTRYQLLPGDLLFVRLSKRGDQIGRCILVDQVPPDVAFSDHMIRVRLNAALDPHYVCLVWNLAPIRDQILASVATSDGQLLTQELIRATCLSIPPLDEQRHIVQTLLSEFAILAQAQAALTIQYDAAQALPAAYINTAVAQLQAEGWPQQRLGDLCCFSSGMQPPKATFSDQRLPGYVRLLHVQDFATDACAVYVRDTPQLQRCRAEDVLFARSGSAGRALRGKAGAYGSALIKACPDPALLESKFLYLLAQSTCFQAHVHTQSQRTARASLTIDDLAGFSLPLPPLAVQRRFAARLAERLAAVEQLQQLLDTRRTTLRALPAALWHRALSGAYDAISD